MARIKYGKTTRLRRKRVLKLAKGYWGAKSKHFKMAKQAVMKSGNYAYIGRKQKKRDFRKLWITRINAACRQNEISYSRFIEGLTKAGVEINRKMLSEIAINDPKMFSELVKVAKDGKAGKITKATEVAGNEVTIGGKTTKAAAKKEVKAEAKEETTDYSKMTVAELKEVAAAKNIDVAGMKKAEIVEALSK